ncbi:isoprenylcysteine carboxylmethyltransferase family protein [Motiliproteus sp. SC1-56]|uniref:methyltransferase family protein n=1 Tax=Motiliproteus sp. SC1-56 TaxID=2799565 RepID=UPI001A8FBF34|nr:hypothetical protein [Motiliproteus sp. SC1-56]
MNVTTHLGVLAVMLGAYFSLHSWLASLACKRWVGRRWPGLLPAYRLLYNGLSVVLLIPILVILWRFDGPSLWQWPQPLDWVMNGLALASLGAFATTLGAYDQGVFSGLAQWRRGQRAVEDDERLRLSFWHRFVRHPWYFFVLVILWTREPNAAQLLFYALVTLYLVVGSRLEERKLVLAYGEAYSNYRQRVPGLLPLPGRSISAAEARDLEQAARRPG